VPVAHHRELPEPSAGPHHSRRPRHQSPPTRCHSPAIVSPGDLTRSVAADKRPSRPPPSSAPTERVTVTSPPRSRRPVLGHWAVALSAGAAKAVDLLPPVCAASARKFPLVSSPPEPPPRRTPPLLPRQASPPSREAGRAIAPPPSPSALVAGAAVPLRPRQDAACASPAGRSRPPDPPR
jgi:hypothetical protein